MLLSSQSKRKNNNILRPDQRAVTFIVTKKIYILLLSKKIANDAM